MIAPLLAAVVATAGAPQQPADAHAIVEKMIARNPALQSYKARVHVDVKMLSFPYLAPKLDGTSYYKRPDTYEVVFDKMPSYAKGFQKIFNDVGDPGAWEKDQNIALDAPAKLWGHPMIVLRLTKKIHSDILDHTLAYVDPFSYALIEMEWYYTSGGKITMTQTYAKNGSSYVLSAQHADIDIPHIRAVADASYNQYQTNVAATSDEQKRP